MDAAEKALPRYFAIRKKEKLPYFKIIQKISCRKQKDIEAMWAEHEKAMQEFDKLKSKSKAEIRDMENADYSLLDLKIDIASKMLESCVFCERR